MIVLKKVCNFEELFLSRYVPDGEWYCPKCNHGMLIEKLEEIAKCLDFHCKKQATEDKKWGVLKLFYSQNTLFSSNLTQ